MTARMLTIALAICLLAATLCAIEVIPPAAPLGARVLLIGEDITAVAFAGVPAPIIATLSDGVETIVPDGAVSGELLVTSKGSTVAVPFTVTLPPGFVTTATLAAGTPNHDLFKEPEAIAIDARTGIVYVADTGHGEVRSITPDGMVRVVAGGFKAPRGIALDTARDFIYVADTGNHVIKRINTDGSVAIIAGSGKPQDRDGQGSTAGFSSPAGITVDSAGNVLVADAGNHKIRIVTPEGVATTLAGTGRPGFANGAASFASFQQPLDVCIREGVVFVADTLNHAIRRIEGGQVSTIAGTGNPGFADGPLAAFQEPTAVAATEDGALLVADRKNNAIRRIAFSPLTVTTIAGGGQAGFLDAQPLIARFSQPADVEGLGVVADLKNDAIRLLVPELIVSAIYPRVGPTLGGTTLRVLGAGFLPGYTSVTLDGESIPVTVVSATELAIETPGGTGLVDLEVTTRWASVRLDDVFRYIDPPLITTITPAKGSTAGGLAVTITGEHFLEGETSVTLDETTAEITAITATELIVTTPAHDEGIVTISVRTPGGTATTEDGFEYLAPPLITSVTPAKGSTTGGLTVTVTGERFVLEETTVSFDETPAEVTATTTTELAVTTPAHAAGTVAVSVTTPGGTATQDAAFQYLAPPAITSFAPMQGQVGTPVTITGENFDTGGNTVTIGGLAAPILAETATEIVITIPPEAPTGRIRIVTAGGDVLSAADFVVIRYTGLTITPPSAALDVAQVLQFTASGVRSDGTLEPLSGVVWSSSDTAMLAVDATGRATGIAEGTAILSASYLGLSATASVTVLPAVPLPPDPASVAPPTDPTVVGTFNDDISFLYSGPNPIQRDVDVTALEPVRLSVIRGSVRDTNGNALKAVTVTIKDHQEHGNTLTRADGLFDLAVNGGGTLVLEYRKDGYLPVQRTTTIPWQQFVWADPVVMTALDAVVTRIQLDHPAMQVATSTLVSDENGTRRALVVVEPNTTAQLRLLDGTLVPAAELHVRATEYSVGPTGPNAMPGVLPRESAYTYCVELSADEAIALGASRVEFSRPVWLYIDNFLNFPVGGAVPVGYYDRTRARWIASPDGRVIKIVGNTAGVADIDVTGDGIADTVAALETFGITPAERAVLAQQYTIGQSLWRSPIPHFTPWDCNWPYLLPGDAVGPNVPEADAASQANGPNCQYGSIIECENMVLRESVELAGGIRLSYRSDRARGYTAGLTFQATLTGATTPASLRRVDLRIQIAGQQHEQSFTPQNGLAADFTWDGKDAYGRPQVGPRTARVSIGYVYKPVLAIPANINPSFGARSNIAVTTSRVPTDVYFWQTYHVALDHTQPDPLGLRGWSLPMHHVLDPKTMTLHRGTGERQSVNPLGATIDRYAGLGTKTAEGSLAREFKFNKLTDIGSAPDGSLYVADVTTSGGSKLYRITRDQRVFTIGGTGNPPGPSDPTSGLATAMNLSIGALALGSDSTIYFTSGTRIFQLRNGYVTHIAGTGQTPSGSIEGQAAKEARIMTAGIAVHPLTGEVYFRMSPRYYRIDSANRIRTAVVYAYESYEMAFAPSGVLHFTGSGQDSKWRAYYVNDRGTSISLAGGGSSTASGVPAKEGAFGGLNGIDIDETGQVFLASYTTTGGRLALVSTDRIRDWIAGGTLLNVSGDGGLALAAGIGVPQGLTVSPSGDLFFIQQTPYPDSGRRSIRFVRRGTFTELDEILIPDGNAVLVFDASGKHLSTRNSRTGATLWNFTYDEDRKLTQASDANGNTITLEREEETARITTAGLTSTLHLTTDGDLESIDLPGERTYHLTYHDGLLSSFTNPKEQTTTFSYDDAGRLIGETDAANATRTLARAGTATNYTVEARSALGRLNRYELEQKDSGELVRTVTDPSGLTTEATTQTNGSTATELPDGTIVSSLTAPDPRWGMSAPFSASTSLTTPSGRRLELKQERSAVLADPTDPFSITGETTVSTINGKSWTAVWNVVTHRETITTPLNRSLANEFDAYGRLIARHIPGLAPLTLSYADGGLLERVQLGSRSISYTYNETRQLTAVSDSLRGGLNLEYDDAGRPSRLRTDAGRASVFEYDANGNLLAIAQSARSHTLSYSPVGDLAAYGTGPSTTTRYEYNRDRQVMAVQRADGERVEIGYDSDARPSSLTAPGLGVEYTWDGDSLRSIGTAEGIQLTYSHDGPLRTGVAWAGPVQGSVSFTYDAAFRLASEAEATYTYDGDGLLLSAGALAIGRDAQNALLRTTSLSNVSDEWTWSAHGEPVTYRAMFNGTSIAELQWARDAGGRITSESEQIGGVSLTRGYGYDQRGRLVRVTTDGITTAEYEYDEFDNRRVHRYVGGVSAAEYDGEDKLASYDSTSYTYSAAGDLRSKVVGGEITSFEYDALGGLKRVSRTGQVIEYLCDGQGRRVGKKVNGSLVQGWLYADELRIVAELDATSTVRTRFVYGTRATVPDYMTRDSRTYRIIADLRGSPLLVIDVETGQVAQRLAYDEFGRVTADSNPGFQPFGFGGGLYDRDTGLVRFGARDYDPHNGRWTTRDPIGFAGGQANLYVYALNDPVNMTDPSGLGANDTTWCLLKGVAAGAIGAVAVAGVATLAGTVGVPTGAVTIGLGALALTGAAILAKDVRTDISEGNWDALAYDIGTAIGGAAGGRAMTRAIPGVSKDGRFRLWDWDQHYRKGAGSIMDWFNTGPTPGSGAGSAGVAGAGAASTLSSQCGCS